MKVLIINGSPRKDGNTARLLREAADVFDREGVEYELYQIGTRAVQGCRACNYCATHDGCVISDDVNRLSQTLSECEGLLVASPVYYASANGSLISLLDRLFYSTGADTRMKVGAALVVARRAGTTATFDELNKYFTISQMPIASGRYWGNGFGGGKGQVEDDEEGLQNARITAGNMVFLMRAIALGKERYGLPDQEEPVFTNFIRE